MNAFSVVVVKQFDDHTPFFKASLKDSFQDLKNLFTSIQIETCDIV